MDVDALVVRYFFSLETFLIQFRTCRLCVYVLMYYHHSMVLSKCLKLHCCW